MLQAYDVVLCLHYWPMAAGPLWRRGSEKLTLVPTVQRDAASAKLGPSRFVLPVLMTTGIIRSEP